MESTLPLREANTAAQPIVQSESPADGPFDAKLDKLVAEALESTHAPGLALAVIDGEETWEKGFGFADVITKEKVEPSTLFPVGSTTKAFTAAAAALLVDDTEKYPKVKWTTPMNELIPGDFVLTSEWATSHITLEDCLCHRTGLASHYADLGTHSVKENVRHLRHLPMATEPRTEWRYSNHSYWAVSHMIEVQTGTPLSEFFHDKIWAPLGMDATFLSLKDAQNTIAGREDRNLAKPYYWDEKDFVELPYWDDEGISGAGAMVSNVTDYIKWIRSFLTQSGPLSAAGYAAVVSPHMVMPPMSARFPGPICCGLGWFMSVYQGEKVLWHPGGVAGFGANMIYFPDKKWGVVGMTNVSGDAVLDAPMWHLIDEFLGTPLDKRADVLAQAAKMEGMKKDHVDGARDRLFSDVKDQVPPSEALSEYAGTYTNAAHGTTTISLVENVLRGRIPARLTLDPMDFEHVSGELFLMKATILNVQHLRVRAKFEIGETASPKRLGMEFEPGIMIWFDKEE